MGVQKSKSAKTPKKCQENVQFESQFQPAKFSHTQQTIFCLNNHIFKILKMSRALQF